ncbi:hypothetical protein [Erwinia tasmaniensis]|nr:hypothetical protein [Erwinia tasmaniensis]
MFNTNILQPLHREDISDRMSQESSAAVQHGSFLNQISRVLAGPVFLWADNEYMKTSQGGTLFMNNLEAVQPAQATASSPSHYSQPEVCRRRKYNTEFVNKVKQELFTHTVGEVAKRYRLPYPTVYKWSIALGGVRAKIKRSNGKEKIKQGNAREKIKRGNGREIAQQSRFHTLMRLKKHCVNRVNDLCSQQQNLRERSQKVIISKVAKEEGICIGTLKSWVVNASNYSFHSRSVFLLPMSTADKNHSVKKSYPRQSAGGNSDAHQLKARRNVDLVKFRANKSSTTPTTVRTDSTDAQKIEKGFVKCFQHLARWLNK